MNILYIGGGFVGACSAAVSADSGHRVLVFDIDDKKMRHLSSGDRETIQSCLFEDGLADLLLRNSERIQFTSSYHDVVAFLDTVDAIFMCLPTPEIGETGESDLSYYTAAATTLATHLAKRNTGEQTNYVLIVNKSTVPIDMVDMTEQMMMDAGVLHYGVVSNPEFLVEGKAIVGSLHPDRVVVGARSEKDFAIMRQVYERFFHSSTVRYIEVTPREAAAGKLLSNFYLFSKLAVCFDVIGRVSEVFPDISFEQLRTIMTSDERIGTWGFYDSLYAGGSCLIKDARSLSYQLSATGTSASLVHETYLANKRQLDRFLTRANTDAGIDWQGKTIAVLGLSFKQDTNDVRNSPSIDIVQILQHAGAKEIRLFDPVAMPSFAQLFPASEACVYCTNEKEAVAGADVVLVATDWPQFRSLPELLLAEQSRPLLMDGRRMLAHKYEELHQAGFSIIAVGSKTMHDVS